MSLIIKKYNYEIFFIFFSIWTFKLTGRVRSLKSRPKKLAKLKPKKLIVKFWPAFWSEHIRPVILKSRDVN